MVDQKVYYLSKVDFLSDLSAEDLAELALNFKWRDYPQGAEIISQGQECHMFYLLTEGKAEALLSKKGQGSISVSRFEPGDTFGEISLVSGKPSPNLVRCRENCKVLALDSEHFSHMLIRWPKLYQHFTEKLSQILNQVNSGLWEAKHKEYLRSALQLTQYEYKFYGVWGSPKTTKDVETRLKDLAETRDHVLIVGERGTGRQMIAWFLHKQRFDDSAPFVVVDGRLFDQQWGSARFGNHTQPENSSPQGANLLEIAEGGTLLIRDINLISRSSQLNLAKALHEISGVTVIGSLQAGTESELAPELLNCMTQTFKVSPLRDRKRDIPFIAQGILEKLAQQNNRATPALAQQATKLLLSHNYRQGNVTELIRVIERAFFLAEGSVIGLEHVFFGPAAANLGGTFNLLSWGWVKKLLKDSELVLWSQRIASGVFITMLSFLLLAPTAVLTKNIFVLVWGLWWPALVIISPFLGRIWCTICPFSFIMETVQKRLHLNRPVPDLLKKYDYLIVTLLFLLIFWAEYFTRMRFHPSYTAVLLIILQAAAIIVGIVYTRHTWCRHLCPLGGFVGMASIGGLLEVRSDASYCLNKCTSYECYKGTAKLSGCPMFQHAPFVDNNLDCKFCFHCVRNCPNGEVQVNLRVPAREVWHLVRINQGYAMFIGTTLAILFPINYFEQFYGVWPQHTWQLWFSLVYWGTAIAAWLTTRWISQPFRTKGASKRIKLAFSFIPSVLAGHIIYQLHFIPGASSLMLGVGLKSSDGILHPFYLPAVTVGQITAAFIGLALTGFSFAMVSRNKEHKVTATQTTNHTNQSLSSR
jgi:polyferredoxin/CRP-like cAMP-binding protein